ncbi:MAG: GNAT family N-acetyltransferase [Nanoarchaeota archaeon]
MITIRDARESDLITCEVMSKIPELEAPEGEYPTVNSLRTFLKKGFFFVAEKERKVIGYLAAEAMNDGWVYLDYFVVDHSARKKKVGSTLLSELMARLKKSHKEGVFLITLKQREETLAFYEKNGFVKGKEYVLYTKKSSQKD